MRSVGCSHVGLVRKLNEDAFLERPDLGLWVVADGMGGMTAGEVASQAIVSALDGIVGPLAARELKNAVVDRLDTVNDQLRALARERGRSVTIGSTVAGLAIREGHFACFWAGDSRVYRWRNGELDQLTRDHSVVQDLVDAGVLRQEDAEQHPQSNVIKRAVGVDDGIALDWVHAPVLPGDVFLLCSDGLTRFATHGELEAAIGDGPIERACDELLQLTLARGARDNVTLVLVTG